MSGESEAAAAAAAPSVEASTLEVSQPSQPINVVLNGKIVGEINKGSRAINSYVNK